MGTRDTFHGGPSPGTGGGQRHANDSGAEDEHGVAGGARTPFPPNPETTGETRSDSENTTGTPRIALALTLDDVVGPPPGALDPGGFEFSPDDQHIAYLHAHLPKDDGATDQNWTSWMLFVMDVQSGTRHACFDPSSLRKCGEASVLGLTHASMGVTRYHWASGAVNPARLLVPQPEAAYVVDVAKINQSLDIVGDGTDRPQTTYISPPRCVVRSTPEFSALDVSISPDGEWVAFVRDSEIHVAPTTATGFETKRVPTKGVRGGSMEMQVPTSTRVTRRTRPALHHARPCRVRRRGGDAEGQGLVVAPGLVENRVHARGQLERLVGGRENQRVPGRRGRIRARG